VPNHDSCYYKDYEGCSEKETTPPEKDYKTNPIKVDITHQRKRELLTLLLRLSGEFLQNTHPHERHLALRMLDLLLLN
jgi:hypothetical protein